MWGPLQLFFFQSLEYHMLLYNTQTINHCVYKTLQIYLPCKREKTISPQNSKQRKCWLFCILEQRMAAALIASIHIVSNRQWNKVVEACNRM